MIVSLLGLAHAAAPPLPACSTSADPKQAEASASLKALYDEVTKGAGDPKSRLKAFKKLSKRVCTADDHAHAAWILLGSQKAEELERAYALGQVAAYHHAPAAKDLVITAYDRWQVALGAPQRYGTATGAACFYPVEEGFTDAQRAQWGAKPLSESIGTFLVAQGHPTEEPNVTTLLRLQLLCTLAP
jgi:hypothetical protein